MIPRNSHAHITLLFLPLSASIALVCSRSLSRADSFLSHTPTHTHTHTHTAIPTRRATQRYSYQGPGCLYRCSPYRSQHGFDIKFHHSLLFSLLHYTPLTYRTPNPLLALLLVMLSVTCFGALLCFQPYCYFLQVELDRLLYSVRATVISIRKQTCCLSFIQAPRHVLMCPTYSLSVYIPCLSDSHLSLLRATGCSVFLLKTLIKPVKSQVLPDKAANTSLAICATSPLDASVLFFSPPQTFF